MNVRFKSTLIFTVTIMISLCLTFHVDAQTWENLPGHARDIAAGGDTTDVVWVIGDSYAAFKWNEENFSWQDMGGEATDIAVTQDGIPWVINDRQIYRLRGDVWQSMPGSARDIASGGGEVFVIGDSRAIYKWNEENFSWRDLGGEAEYLAVDEDGIPWAVQDRQIYRLRGDTWQSMPGSARAIGAGGGEVWAVGDSRAVYRWSEDNFGWQDLGGEASEVTAAGATGTPYVIEDNGTLIYRLRGWNN